MLLQIQQQKLYNKIYWSSSRVSNADFIHIFTQ